MGHPCCPSPWHMACPSLPRRMARVQSHAGRGAGSWRTAQMRPTPFFNSQRDSIHAGQGWRRAPRSSWGCRGPQQAEEEGGTREMQVIEWAVGHIQEMWGQASCCISALQATWGSHCPVVSTHPQHAPALEAVALLLPLPSRGWGCGVEGRLGARSHTGTLQLVTSWHHQRDVRENQDPVSARGRGLEGEGTHRPFFPTPSHANISHPCGSQPGCKHLLGLPPSMLSQNSLG